VYSLAEDHSGRVWAGTADGLVCFTGSGPRVLRLAADFGSNYIDLVRVSADGRLWVGTNNGLFQVGPDSLLNNGSGVTHYTTSDGLLSLECNLNASHLDTKGRLLFGTSRGLVVHLPAVEHTPTAEVIPLHITGLRWFLRPSGWEGRSAGTDTLTGLPTGLLLPYERNHLTFDYAGISLSAPEQVVYRYRLLGHDNDWLPETDVRSASFSNLPHGHYVFQVMAKGRNGLWSAPKEYAFDVQPPFWARWWFFALTGAVVIGSVGGVARYRSLQRRRQERTRQLMLRSRMLQLEQQALNANMNRHFIFNALNSIQYHINKQDRATANRYLTSFAKLIRKNLDASQSDTTSLAEELERLELYLVLEHMRFKDRFRYVLTVEPGVDTLHVRLPAMMLQPYVENSIWHGILPTERQGQVTIRVSPGGPGRVRVTIADDGLGIEQSKARKQDGDHISRGIEITKGRADVLRNLQVTDIRITGPEQVQGPDGKVHGTQVTIDLPGNGPSPRPETDLRSGPGHPIFGT
jgi:two-component sensor histidine kinase